MLVRDPAKRATLATVSKHAWMRAEVPHKALTEQSKSHEQLVNSNSASGGSSPPKELATQSSTGVKHQKMNDQVLRVMQSLGIDPKRTKESVIGEWKLLK